MNERFKEHFESDTNPDLKNFTFSKKKGLKNSFQAGNDYLPLLLQKIESRIFIETILPALQIAGFDVVPRHDSFLCTESDGKAVRAIIEIELHKLFDNG